MRSQQLSRQHAVDMSTLLFCSRYACLLMLASWRARLQAARKELYASPLMRAGDAPRPKPYRILTYLTTFVVAVAWGYFGVYVPEVKNQRHSAWAPVRYVSHPDEVEEDEEADTVRLEWADEDTGLPLEGHYIDFYSPEGAMWQTPLHDFRKYRGRECPRKFDSGATIR